MSDELETGGTEKLDNDTTITPTTDETENTESTTTDENLAPAVKDEPKLVVHNEDCIFQYDFEPYKYKNCFRSGECCYKLITMPEGYVREEDIKSDFAV